MVVLVLIALHKNPVKTIKVMYDDSPIPRKEFKVGDKFFMFYRGQAQEVPAKVGEVLVNVHGLKQV